ncbi:MAG: pyridoxal phosphate-dependent aminotransferase [Planctomycetota bacterium]
MTRGPLQQLHSILPAEVQQVVKRATPIPSIALQATQQQQRFPQLVRADIGQITGYDSAREVLYGPPVGLERLRQKLSELWNLTYSIAGGLTAKNVAVTTGAAEGLSLLFRCFASGKRVGLPTGHWENYVNGVQMAGGTTTTVDYFTDHGTLDGEHLTRQIRAQKIEVLVSNFPCNPTGAVLTAEEAQCIAEVARATDVLLISDEVYHRLRYDGHPPVTLLQHAPERTLVVGSASKEYLLPGARTGWVISQVSEVTDVVLRKLIRSNTASPNVLGQERVLELLEEEVAELSAGKEPSFIVALREELRSRKENLVKVLSEFGFSMVGRVGHVPQGTIFLMAGIPDWWSGSDEDLAERALEAGCFSCIPGSAFGLPGSVRFSFGGMTLDAIEQLRENLRRFREECGGAKGSHPQSQATPPREPPHPLPRSP